MNLSKLALGLSALFTFIAFNSAYAGTQLVLKGTSDAFQGDLDLNVITDDQGNATQIQTISADGINNYDVSKLTAGILLYAAKGHNVLTVKSADFDVAHGGKVEVDYLFSGLNNSYHSVIMDVQNNNAQWQVLADDQAGHTVVTKAFFKSNKFFGQIVGVSSITFSN